jgi:hypothetical protein
MGYSLDDCVQRISVTLEPLGAFQSTPSILLLRYEEMMADRGREIRRIASHLGLRLDDATVGHIDAHTNLESCQKVCESLKDRPAEKVLMLANHRIDPTTQLHQNHLNGGTVGRWKHEFSVEQIAYVNEFFAPWLLKLGYETPRSLDMILR